MTLPKILIVAPNVSARLGGEAVLPLHYFRILTQRGYHVRLLAHERNRAELESLAGCDPAHLHFVPDTAAHRAVWRVFSPFPDRVRDLIGGAILTWLDGRHQARLIRRLRAEGEVDLIHQPTPVSPLSPTGLHRFGVPLVVGPMNGGMDYPASYEDYESRATRASVALGRRAARLFNRVQSGKRRAAAILVANERTRAALPDPSHPHVHLLVENGVDFACWRGAEGEATRAPSQAGRLRLVFVGRLVRWKGVDITLRALTLARAGGVDATLDILGEGEERARLEALARDLGLGVAVAFHGFVPQARCAQILAGADALVLNSLRECGGAVVLEAMASGLPVVASAWGGPADYLTDDCGILLDPTPRESFAERLAAAFSRLAGDPAGRLAMGRTGRAIARSGYDWEAKVDRMIEIYAEASRRSGTQSSPAGHHPSGGVRFQPEP